MQEIILYATANEVLARVRDRANAKAATPPTLARGCGFRLKIRLFANAYDDTPYPLANLANITSWAFVMDSDWDSATPFKIVADAGEIAVGEVQDQYEGEVVTYTEAVVPVSETNTEELAAWLGSDEGKDGLNAELIGYDGTGEEAFVLQIKGFSVRNRLGSVGDPTPIPSEYLNADQVRALIASGAVLQFSPDGATWKDSQEDGDIYLRFRSASDASAAWSPAIALPRGANGADGESAFLYVRYASDAEGTGFSATPSPSLPFVGILATATALDPVDASAFSGLWVRYLGEGTPGKDGSSAYIYVAYASDSIGSNFSLEPTSGLKYRAELHTTIPLDSPNASDFSGLTWVKYIGDDGAGAGDMQKAVYDIDDDGVVDSAEKLATARKIGSANFDGTGDISLSDMGAQPALPTNGEEGQFLQKTASGVAWATPHDSWGQISGDIQNQADLYNALNGKISSPSGGTAGQVLTKTANGAEWATPPSTGGGSGASWGQITGDIQTQADLANALGEKISSPSGGTAGQFLQKTESGFQWATVEGGGSSGSGAEYVRHASTLEEYNAICSLSSSAGSGGVVPFVALNDIDLASDDIFEPGTETVSSSLKRGHTYVRIDAEFTAPYISSGGGASATRTVDISTYFVKDFWLVNNSTGSQVDNWAFRAWRGGRNILADNAVAIAAGYGYGYGWKDKEEVHDPLRWLMNGKWPTVVIGSPETLEARLMAYLEVDGTYLGTNPDDLTSSGTNGATLKRIAGVWRKGNISRDSGMNLVETYDMETTYSIQFMYRTSSGSSSTTATPMSTETVTETWGTFSGAVPEAITDRLQLTGDITPGLPRKAEEATYAATLEVNPGDCLSVSLAGNMAISAIGGVDGVRQTASIDILPGAHTVSAGPGLAIVDAPTADKINHCEIRWWGSSATLHVLYAEDAPSGGGSEEPGGDTPTDVWPTKIVISGAASTQGSDVSAFNGDYVRTGETLTILGETVPIWSNGSKYIYGMSSSMGSDLNEPAIALQDSTGQNDAYMSYYYRMKSGSSWERADAANAIGFTATITEEGGGSGSGGSSDAFPTTFTVTACSGNEAAKGEYTRTGEKTTVGGKDYPVYSYTQPVLATSFYIYVCQYRQGSSGAFWSLKDGSYSASDEGYSGLGFVAVNPSTGLPMAENWSASGKQATVTWA